MKGMVIRMTAIILDVDGTLWDTTGVVAAAWTKAAEALGMEPECPITADRLKQEFGKPMDEIAANLFPEYSKEQQTDIMNICCKYEEDALEACDETLLFDTVAETLPLLSQTHPLYIVSNCQKGYIELFLEKNHLGSYVRDFECFGNTGLSKGENIQLLMQREHLRLTDALYVGDTQGDCDACRFAQIPFYFAGYGFGSPDSYVQKLEKFSDLLDLKDIG